LKYKIWFIILILLIIGFFYNRLNYQWVDYKSGEVVSSDPLQFNIKDKKDFKYKGYSLIPLAEFKISARVLSRHKYSFGREAALSPYDLALGWGPMSNYNIVKDIKVSQSNRWYHYRYKLPPPIPKHEIIKHSANMHLVPSSDKIKKTIAKVKRGQIVHFSGYLIRIMAKDGWRWESSTTRTDSGSGSCELVWVDEFYVN